MNNEILKKIKVIKKELDQEGFIILGIFGSYARGDETDESDIDILYETNSFFNSKYKGLKYFGKIHQIKEDFERALNKQIDIADKNALNKIGEKYILPEVINVA